jgi:hypothetical protein
VHACLDDLVIALYVTIDEWLEPAEAQATHPSSRTPNWSAWPSPRCCWATAPSAAGCARSTAGSGTCSPMSVARPPTTAACAGPRRWSRRSCTPWPAARRRGATSGGCWMPPRSHAAKAGRRSSVPSWPAGPATAMTPAIHAGTGASSCTCWPARTACRPLGAWPTPATANVRLPRCCWTGPPASGCCGRAWWSWPTRAGRPGVRPDRGRPGRGPGPA